MYTMGKDNEKIFKTNHKEKKKHLQRNIKI